MKKNTFVIFIYLLLDIIAFSSVLPLFTEIINSFSNNQNDICYNSIKAILEKIANTLGLIRNDKDTNALIGGFLGSVLCLFQFLCTPIFGSLSDYLGRKIILLLTTICLLFSYLVWACSYWWTSGPMTTTFSIFLISRILIGLSRANVAVSIATIGDSHDKSTHSVGMAWIGIAFSLGFIIGPSLGVFFIQSANQVAWLSFVLGLVELIWLWFMFNETLPNEKRIKDLKTTFTNIWNYINPISIFYYRPMTNLDQSQLRNARRLGFVYFSYMMVYSGLEFSLTFLTHQKFGFTAKEQGRMFVFMGLIMILVQGIFVRRFRKKQQEKIAVLFGLFSLAISLGILGQVNTLFQLYLGLTLFSIASGCVVPCLTTLVSQTDSTNTPQQGRLIGLLRSQGCLARTLSPLLFSSLFSLFSPAYAYYCGSVILLLIPIPIFILNK